MTTSDLNDHDRMRAVSARDATWVAGHEQRSTEQLRREESRLVGLGVPASLIKAVTDPYDYRLALRDGTRFDFESATIDMLGRWAHLAGWSNAPNAPQVPLRGVDVRIADIVWCADMGPKE